MPIAGMTDRTDKPYKNLLGGKIYKGTKSSKTDNKPGSDLKEKFRIECATPTVAGNLKKVYPSAQVDTNGDILVDNLEIMFASEDKDKTFDAWMRHWSGSALLRQCDRHTIKFESELKEDMWGNKRHIQIACNKPCPVREEAIGIHCPLGCTQEATISFYIRSPRIRQLGIDFPLPFQMTVTGYTDLDVISRFLDETLEKFNSLKFHNLADYFGNKIPIGEWGITLPFILSRSKIAIKRPVLHRKGEGQEYKIEGTTYQKRTGKKADGIAWACSFDPDPKWLRDYEEECDRIETDRRIRQELQFLAEVKSSGLVLSAQKINMLTGGAIDVEVISPPALPGAQTITKEDWTPVYSSFLKFGWTKEGIFNLLSELGFAEPNQIPFSRLKEIEAIAPSEIQMQHFNGVSF